MKVITSIINSSPLPPLLNSTKVRRFKIKDKNRENSSPQETLERDVATAKNKLIVTGNRVSGSVERCRGMQMPCSVS